MTERSFASLRGRRLQGDGRGGTATARMNFAFIVIMTRSPRSTAALPRRPLAVVAFVCFVLSVLGAGKCAAYSLSGKKWPSGSVVTFQMGLGAAARTLLDGNTSWDAAAAPAATAWDNVMARLQFRTTIASPPTSSGDGVNAIVFSSTVFGQSFGSGTLAVTFYSYTSAGVITEADVLFNNHESFDSYRGNLHYGSNGWAIGDIRRVLIHELGHALGLDHPDDNGQHVDAIMNSVTSNRETLSSDDIAGAQALYGASTASPTPTPLPTATPSATPALSRFGNISTRMNVGTGDNVMIGGFTISGSAQKAVVVRVLGPTLAGFGVTRVLADPALELHDSTGAVIATNDDWQSGTQGSQLTASGYAPGNGNEPALIATLAPGAYSAIVRGAGNATGIALIEVYQLDSLGSRLSNLSTRGRVGTGDNVLIGGIIITGGSPKRMVVRALGPTMAGAPFSVRGTLSNPTLELHNGSGTLIYSNDDWTSGTQAAELRASGYGPPNASESAIIATLPAGNYSAIVRGVNNTTGVALIDTYDLD
ncbi:MAG: hypothetical protein DLM52_09140 [Chthoniobacterales bacterium]|nr:MAG: hypothetical protein DLM52_09140 [Chthoniobacterales bacterium]